MQQSDVVTGPSATFGSSKLALSDEARASLEAVRVAQESARVRLRRQTTQARIRFAILLGAVGLTAAAFGPRIARGRTSHAKAAKPAVVPARPSPLSPAAAAPVTMASAAAPVAAKASENSLRTLEPPPAPETNTAHVVAATEARAVDSEEGCDATSIRHAWRLSPDACVRAFEADPTNASLALAAAQAHHAKAHLGEAAQWAKRALALNPKAAEAYIIVAHDDRANGRPDAAREAYRRYLEVAPRGWHQAEARAALRTAASPR